MDEEQAAEEEEGVEKEKMETRLLDMLRNKSLQAGEPPGEFWKLVIKGMAKGVLTYTSDRAIASRAV